MTKYGRPDVGLAAVDDLGDIGVAHQGQGLALGLEAGDDLARVHPRLDDLERHHPADRLVLLGHEDHAEAALADRFEELVGADLPAGAFANLIVGRDGDTFGGLLEKALVLLVDAQQGLQPRSQLLIIAADLIDVEALSVRADQSAGPR